MTINFYKYQGTGNDFVVIDNRSGKFNPSKSKVAKICDRRFGVGADGLILLENHPKLDFYMNYYNSDGTKSFCGNGSRCVVRFASHLGIIGMCTAYEAIDGMHTSQITDTTVATDMLPVVDIERINEDLFINTGSPHYIIFTENTDNIDVVKEAREIRYNKRFKEEGTNVNFVSYKHGDLKVRTYERGVEDETLSCGTGVTAVAIAHCIKHKLNGKQSIPVATRGGMLTVELIAGQGSFEDIKLIGPAEKVYQGTISI